jgi:hypothetical protein
VEQARNRYGINAVGEKALVSAILLAVTIPVFYGAEALVTRHSAAPWLVTRWDAEIPLVPGAVWIYMSWYLAPWLLLAAPAREFRRAASAIVVAFTVCMICYAVIPAAIERPAVLGQTLSERALRFLYEHDPPWNICPSFHAALCAVLWRSAAGGAVAKWMMKTWMAAICAACVLTKQHNLLDIAAGIAVGGGAVGAASAALRHLEGAVASTAASAG